MIEGTEERAVSYLKDKSIVSNMKTVAFFVTKLIFHFRKENSLRTSNLPELNTRIT